MRFLIYALATWRLAHLLASERGPYDVLGRLRGACGVGYEADGSVVAETEAARLVTCVWCSSPWLAGGLGALRWLWPALADWLAGALAASAVTIAIERHLYGNQ